MVAPEQRHGDADEAGAAGEPELEVVLVPEHEVGAAQSRDRARERHRRHLRAADAHAAKLRRGRVEPHGPQLVAQPRAEQQQAHAGREQQTQDQREIDRGLKN